MTAAASAIEDAACVAAFRAVVNRHVPQPSPALKEAALASEETASEPKAETTHFKAMAPEERCRSPALPMSVASVLTPALAAPDISSPF